MARVLDCRLIKTGAIGRPRMPLVARECLELAIKCLEASNDLLNEICPPAHVGDTASARQQAELAARAQAYYENLRSTGEKRIAHRAVKISCATIDEYLIPILDFILRFPGCELRSAWFPDSTKLKAILHTLWKGNLIKTKNWPNAGKRYRGVKSLPKARIFTPHKQLLKTSQASTTFVRSGKDYLLKKSVKPRARRYRAVSAILLNKKAGLELPAIVIDALRAGTGLYADTDALHALMQLHRISLDDLRGKLLVNSNEIVPSVWAQNKCGNINARGPAIQNLMKELRPALRSMDRSLKVYDVDFSGFNPRLTFCLNDDPASASGDDLKFYEIIAERLHISRDEAKILCNSFLNGRTALTISHSKDPNKEWLAKHWPELLIAVQAGYPKLYDFVLQYGRRITEPLYKLAARVFIPCYAKGLEITGGKSGIPLHDGWIVAATPAQAEEITRAWKRIARDETDAEMLVNCTQISE